MGEIEILRELAQPATFILMTIIGWGVSAIWKQVRSSDKKIDALRTEMHAELQEYTRKETCAAHREGLQLQLDHIKEFHGYCISKNGIPIVNLNDVDQMSRLHSLMTPAERKEHASKCQFVGDMEHKG